MSIILYAGNLAYQCTLIFAGFFCVYLFNFNCRKAAQKWHPDNFQGDEKKIAEKKFIDIAAAKEVLTDQGKSCFIFYVSYTDICPVLQCYNTLHTIDKTWSITFQIFSYALCS